MSYLRYLCLFVHSVVQHILCCVFALFFFVMLPVSLDCRFWIVPSVFFNVYRYTLYIHILSYLSEGPGGSMS